jgi:hypothetical protein
VTRTVSTHGDEELARHRARLKMVCLPMVGAATPSSMVARGPRLRLLMEGATAVGNQEGADGGGVEPWKGAEDEV